MYSRTRTQLLIIFLMTLDGGRRGGGGGGGGVGGQLSQLLPDSSLYLIDPDREIKHIVGETY